MCTAAGLPETGLGTIVLEICYLIFHHKDSLWEISCTLVNTPVGQLLEGVSAWLKFSSDYHIVDSLWSLLNLWMFAFLRDLPNSWYCQDYCFDYLLNLNLLISVLLTLFWSSCLISGSKNLFQIKIRHWQLFKTYTNDPDKHTCLIRNRCKYNFPNIFGRNSEQIML